jgi:putative MFS transporter
MNGSDALSIHARLDRLPSCRPLWSWIARISFGAFFEIYETALTTLLPPLLVSAGIFRKDAAGLFGLPDLATFSFATFVGLFIGALLFSALTDRFGRRPIFTYSLLWYAVATLVMAFQTEPIAICLWRMIAAVGVGAEIIAVDSYIADVMPKALRGKGFAISKSIQYTAVPLAAILAAILSKRAIAGIAGWQWMLVVPTIGAIFIWWVRRGLPESPRWLANHGRLDEASRILDAVEAAVRARTGRDLPPITTGSQSMPEIPDGHVGVFRGELLHRTLMLIIVSCSATISYFGFGTWLPSLLVARGVEVTKSLVYTAIIALSYPVAPFAFSLFADRVERKWQIVAGSTVVVIAGLLFAVQMTVAGWLIFGLLVTIGGHLTSTATHTYRSELYPTRLRARGIGVVYSIDRLAAAFNSYLIGFILIGGGPTAVLIFIAVMSSVAVLAVAIAGPRVRGLASEAIRNRVSRGAGERVEQGGVGT